MSNKPDWKSPIGLAIMIGLFFATMAIIKGA